MADDRAVLAERARATFRLHDEGVQLMRENLRRRNPDADEEEISRLLSRWLCERPIEPADGFLRRGTWPRK